MRYIVLLIEYCTGLIFVCTVLLVVATSLTIKNYWLIRDLTSPPEPPEPRERRGSRVERYDSDLTPENWRPASDPKVGRH
jgi:hypothetical protein